MHRMSVETLGEDPSRGKITSPTGDPDWMLLSQTKKKMKKTTRSTHEGVEPHGHDPS